MSSKKKQWTKEDEAKFQQAMLLLELKYRVQALEKRRANENNEALATKIISNLMTWFVPRYFDYPKK